MQTTFIEATQRAEGSRMANWGKFMVARFDSEEWSRQSALPGVHQSLLSACGWGAGPYFLVLDLQTGEGAIFRLGGKASADLDKHRVWVCPMFEPFLEWLYEQTPYDLSALPPLVELPNAEFAMSGYRRAGPEPNRKHAET